MRVREYKEVIISSDLSYFPKEAVMMSTDAVSGKERSVYELKDGFSIDLTEEEYLAKEVKSENCRQAHNQYGCIEFAGKGLQAASSRPFHYILFPDSGK